MTLLTLTVNPGFVVQAEDSYNVVETDWHDGAHKAQLVTPARVRHWTLTWPVAPQSERDAIVAVWDAVRGMAGCFNCGIPDEGTVVVQFGSDAFRAVQQSAVSHSMEIQLVEALNNDG